MLKVRAREEKSEINGRAGGCQVWPGPTDRQHRAHEALTTSIPNLLGRKQLNFASCEETMVCLTFLLSQALICEHRDPVPSTMIHGCHVPMCYNTHMHTNTAGWQEMRSWLTDRKRPWS